MFDRKICLRILYDYGMCGQDDLIEDRQLSRIMLISSLETGELIGFCLFKENKLTRIIIDNSVDFKGKVFLTEEKIWSMGVKYYYNIRFVEFYQAISDDKVIDECFESFLEYGFKEYSAFLVDTYIGEEIEI